MKELLIVAAIMVLCFALTVAFAHYGHRQKARINQEKIRDREAEKKRIGH